MSLTRKTFTLGSFIAAAGPGTPLFAEAAEGKTLAIMFDNPARVP